MSMLKWSVVVLASVGGSALAQSGADSYPSRPVTVIAAIAAGGGIDVEARMYTTKLSPLMGQQFLLDFKPGAAGTIGAAYVAKAKPDGYTLHVVGGGFSVFPAFYKDLPFDVVKDFAAVSLMSERTSVLQVSTKFPAKTFNEVIAYARANPGKVNYGTTGPGSITHLAGAWLADAAKVKFTFIHYKGTGPLLQEMVSGRLDMGSGILAAALPIVKAGRTQAIAMLNNKRSTLLPNIPTVEEQGIPGYNYTNWMGFLAPAATPMPIVNKLSTNLAQVARMPDILAVHEKSGSVSVGSSPGEFRELIASEAARWQRIVKEAGITLEE